MPETHEQLSSPNCHFEQREKSTRFLDGLLPAPLYLLHPWSRRRFAPGTALPPPSLESSTVCSRHRLPPPSLESSTVCSRHRSTSSVLGVVPAVEMTAGRQRPGTVLPPPSRQLLRPRSRRGSYLPTSLWVACVALTSHIPRLPVPDAIYLLRPWSRVGRWSRVDRWSRRRPLTAIAACRFIDDGHVHAARPRRSREAPHSLRSGRETKSWLAPSAPRGASGGPGPGAWRCALATLPASPA